MKNTIPMLSRRFGFQSQILHTRRVYTMCYAKLFQPRLLVPHDILRREYTLHTPTLGALQGPQKIRSDPSTLIRRRLTRTFDMVFFSYIKKRKRNCSFLSSSCQLFVLTQNNYFLEMNEKNMYFFYKREMKEKNEQNKCTAGQNKNS